MNRQHQTQKKHEKGGGITEDRYDTHQPISFLIKPVASGLRVLESWAVVGIANGKLGGVQVLTLKTEDLLRLVLTSSMEACKVRSHHQHREVKTERQERTGELSPLGAHLQHPRP